MVKVTTANVQSESSHHDGPTPGRFTLFHLALVFLVIGLLTALILPPWMVGRREFARRAVCANSLRQIGLAIRLYAEDNGGRCPVDAVPPTLPGCMQLIWKEVSPRTLICPSDRRPNVRAVSPPEMLTANHISYSYVPNLVWKPAPQRVVVLDRIGSTLSGSPWEPDSNHASFGGNVLFTDETVRFVDRLPADLVDQNGNHIVLSP